MANNHPDSEDKQGVPVAWTIEALKEYVDQRFSATDRAIDKASVALDERLGGMNQFRAQIASERAQLLSKDEYDQRHTALELRIEANAAKAENRIGALERWQSKIIGALALVIFVTPVITGLTVWLITHHNAP